MCLTLGRRTTTPRNDTPPITHRDRQPLQRRREPAIAAELENRTVRVLHDPVHLGPSRIGREIDRVVEGDRTLPDDLGRDPLRINNHNHRSLPTTRRLAVVEQRDQRIRHPLIHIIRPMTTRNLRPFPMLSPIRRVHDLPQPFPQPCPVH